MCIYQYIYTQADIIYNVHNNDIYNNYNYVSTSARNYAVLHVHIPTALLCIYNSAPVIKLKYSVYI